MSCLALTSQVAASPKSLILDPSEVPGFNYRIRRVPEPYSLVWKRKWVLRTERNGPAGLEPMPPGTPQTMLPHPLGTCPKGSRLGHSPLISSFVNGEQQHVYFLPSRASGEKDFVNLKALQTGELLLLPLVLLLLNSSLGIPRFDELNWTSIIDAEPRIHAPPPGNSVRVIGGAQI